MRTARGGKKKLQTRQHHRVNSAYTEGEKKERMKKEARERKRRGRNNTNAVTKERRRGAEDGVRDEGRR